MDVAFFGGSFNPPHFGHTLAAAYARGRGFERVLVVPVATHAFGKPLAPFEHRVEMARRAFQPIEGVSISLIERQLAAPNYTLATLRAVQEQNPAWRLRLLVGSDLIDELQGWHRFEEVERLAPLFIVERATADAERPGFFLAQVSSTEVRHCLSRRFEDPAARTLLDERVPAAVLSYIDEHRLYL